jgi:hypothetical protein
VDLIHKAQARQDRVLQDQVVEKVRQMGLDTAEVVQ